MRRRTMLDALEHAGRDIMAGIEAAYTVLAAVFFIAALPFVGVAVLLFLEFSARFAGQLLGVVQ